MRRSDNCSQNYTIYRKQIEKWPRERLRKRWSDVVEMDLEKIEMNSWKNIIQDREKWREVVKVTKYLVE